MLQSSTPLVDRYLPACVQTATVFPRTAHHAHSCACTQQHAFPAPPSPALPPHRSHTSPPRTRLYLYRGWWSAHAPPAAPLTVFTMASLDRLAPLEAQCRSFAGPHVAAVYLPLRVAAEVAEGANVTEAQAAVRGAGKQAAAVTRREVQEEGGSGEEIMGDRRESARGERLRVMGARGGGGEGGGGGVIPGHEALGWLSEAHLGQVREAERSLQVGAVCPVPVPCGRGCGN